MDQPPPVRFAQRAAYLHQDVNDVPLGLRPVQTNQLLQVHPFQQLHGIVKDPLGRAAVIVNGNRVRVIQLAGQRHLALECLIPSSVVFSMSSNLMAVGRRSIA